ncbi:hypothetical protein Golob_001667, partial [Gossypium lobatum]|nr:hypothetical protein [Gossypium lobatum]
GFSDEDHAEQLRASVDFLVELCSSSSPVQESKFKNWSHQAVDFILGNHEMDLCFVLVGGFVEADRIFENENAQRLLRNENPRSDSIEHGLKSPRFRPPLDSAKLTFQIQLIEFLVSDYLLTWSTNEDFENSRHHHSFLHLIIYTISTKNVLDPCILHICSLHMRHIAGVFEEWVTSLLQARKSVEVLESRNGLYLQYMDRVVGELSKLVGQSPALLKLNSGIFDALLS